MAAIIPAIGAIASAIAPLAGAFLGGGAPEPPSPQAPPPPPEIPEETSTEPEGVLDQEAAKARAIKRRQEAKETSLLSIEDDENTEQKKLLGE